MALSGSQKTQVGRRYSGVGRKQSFSPKAASGITSTKKLTTVQSIDRGFGQLAAARLGGKLQ